MLRHNGQDMLGYQSFCNGEKFALETLPRHICQYFLGSSVSNPAYTLGLLETAKDFFTSSALF